MIKYLRIQTIFSLLAKGARACHHTCFETNFKEKSNSSCRRRRCIKLLCTSKVWKQLFRVNVLRGVVMTGITTYVLSFPCYIVPWKIIVISHLPASSWLLHMHNNYIIQQTEQSPKLHKARDLSSQVSGRKRYSTDQLCTRRKLYY